jgi:hypothetical protein
MECRPGDQSQRRQGAEIYRDFGFELVSVEPGTQVERVSIIKAAIR